MLRTRRHSVTTSNANSNRAIRCPRNADTRTHKYTRTCAVSRVLMQDASRKRLILREFLRCCCPSSASVGGMAPAPCVWHGEATLLSRNFQRHRREPRRNAASDYLGVRRPLEAAPSRGPPTCRTSAGQGQDRPPLKGLCVALEQHWQVV